MLEKRDSYFLLREDIKLKRLFLILFGLVLLGLGFIYRYYLWPFLFAVIFYLALRPFYEKLVALVKSRMIGSLIMVLLVVLLILIPLFLLLLSLANQTYELYLYAQLHFDPNAFNEWISRSAVVTFVDTKLHISRGEIIAKIMNVVQQTSLAVFSNLTGVLTFSVQLAVNFFFMLLILFFIFKDARRFEKSFYRVLPFPDDIEKDVVDRLKDVVKILIAGNLVIMMLQGFMVGIAYFMVGLRAPLLWGSIAAVLSLIPVIGTTLVWLPAVLFLAATGHYAGAVFLGAWCLSWYLLLENLVKPNIFGKKLNFHPLVFFFLLLGSIQSFGLSGVIVGPVLLTLFYSLWEIYKLLIDYNSTDGGPTVL